MKGRNQHLCLQWCLAQWILLLIYFILPHSEAYCLVPNCNLSQCYRRDCGGCNDGYFLQYEFLCEPCQQSLQGCATCSSDTSCTKCNDGYYLQTGSCIQCQQSLQGCATCSSSTSCTKCNDGYYLQTGSCIQCQQSLQGCATCSSSTSCTKCNDGYYLQSGSCIQCQQSLQDCATCSSSTYCTKCNDGYYLQSGSCIQCPDRCATCTSSTQCTTCKDTYWNILDGCYSTCSTNCANNTCDDTTGFCLYCEPGTYGPTCSQDCNICKDGQCDLRKCTNGCKYGYFQENTASGYSFCFKCAYGNCLTCSNATYCSQCEQGYYRNYYRQSTGSGIMVCLQCDDICLDCTSTEHCHEDCIQHCYETINPRNTQSSHETTTISNEDCQRLNEKLYEELNRNQQQIKTCRESEDQYQLTFGHGLATGIGISIMLFGSGVGIAFFIRRRTKPHKHANKASDETNVYVNTDMSNILSVIASESNEVTNDIPTVSSDLTNTRVTNIDSSRD